MEWGLIKEYLLSKEDMLNLGKLSSKKDGTKIKTCGHLTMISNGLQGYAISTI
jgi:hypothetical protein